MNSFLFLIYLFVFVPSVSIAVDPCIYDINPRGVINLKSVGKRDGNPRWLNIEPERKDDHVYSYNPCNPFSLSTCTSVAGCQAFSSDVTLTYSLGDQNSAQWKFTPGQDNLSLVYQTNERTLTVHLVCSESDSSDKLVVHGEDTNQAFYSMTLTSPCACWNGCDDNGSKFSRTTLSGGAVFVILLFAVTIIYLVGFILFNKFKRQATGLEILPHRDFWRSVGGYALDGVRFVTCRSSRRSANYSVVP